MTRTERQALRAIVRDLSRDTRYTTLCPIGQDVCPLCDARGLTRIRHAEWCPIARLRAMVRG